MQLPIIDVHWIRFRSSGTIRPEPLGPKQTLFSSLHIFAAWVGQKPRLDRAKGNHKRNDMDVHHNQRERRAGRALNTLIKAARWLMPSICQNIISWHFRLLPTTTSASLFSSFNTAVGSFTFPLVLNRLSDGEQLISNFLFSRARTNQYFALLMS